MILLITPLFHVASRKSTRLSRRSPQQTHPGRLGDRCDARLIDLEGNAVIAPEDGQIGAGFVFGNPAAQRALLASEIIYIPGNHDKDVWDSV